MVGSMCGGGGRKFGLPGVVVEWEEEEGGAVSLALVGEKGDEGATTEAAAAPAAAEHVDEKEDEVPSPFPPSPPSVSLLLLPLLDLAGVSNRTRSAFPNPRSRPVGKSRLDFTAVRGCCCCCCCLIP